MVKGMYYVIVSTITTDEYHHVVNKIFGDDKASSCQNGTENFVINEVYVKKVLKIDLIMWCIS